MILDSGYIEKNLIAYIGNKRRLLDLIKKSILKTDVHDKENIKFLDLFAGTGVVSRLAKNLGLETYTNDWEYYSYVMNKTFLGLNKDFLDDSFEKIGGVEKALEILNRDEDISEENRYFSKYYCPEDDNKPDTENERMFWTNYNGKKIDLIRSKIEEWKNSSLINEDEENFLLSLLIYEASTRSNTSGVFKGFHKGFGGTNGDALTRIMKKIELKIPTLIDGKKSFVYNEDALELTEKLKRINFDIAYLDPPYNQHQYGSNYHILNTIALNDKPPVNKNVILAGKKVNKSAIRKDWVKTKSSFCYKKKASEDFKKIIENINARFILVSYSTDGIIPFCEMLEILSSKGKLSIETAEYVKFRGGKQSLTNEISNIEFVLIVDSTLRSDISDITKINNILSAKRIDLIMKKTVNPLFAEAIGFQYKHRIIEDGLKIEKILTKKYKNYSLEYTIDKNQIIGRNYDEVTTLPSDIIEEVLSDLEYITNISKEDEIYLVLKEIENYYNYEIYDEINLLFKKIPYLLSKFNNKKAYSSSLKCISDILKMMNKTVKVWANFNIIEDKNFAKLEKIILLKLNLKTEADYSKEKNEIGELYDMLLDSLEKKQNIPTKIKKGAALSQINGFYSEFLKTSKLSSY
ncbi:MAG TPA: DNA adenine methylase [Spirochaetota bacterium]|nr:DNA adenine methylase [Spirochaetota bacterium]